MNDLISRQAAIDAAMEELDGGTPYDIPNKITELPSAEPDADYDDGEYWGYSIAQIESAPTVGPEPKWIPTSIRKPDKAGQYLVTKQQKTKGVRQLATAHYNPALDDWSGNGNFTNVLAWMPLPTIYGGE